MPYPRYTYEQLKHHTPSRRDGISEQKEAKLRHSYCKLIESTGQALRLPQYLIATGIYLAHQFFAVRSMKRNDRFLISAGALYLASKIEDPVRNVMDIVHHAHVFRFRHEPERITAFRESHSQQARLREAVLEAETRILHLTGFDFFVEQPYCHVFRLLNDLKLSRDQPDIRTAIQLVWTLINDSRRSTLWLQYQAKVLAGGLMVLAFRYLKIEMDWDPLWNFIGEEGKDAVGDICTQMLELYGPCGLHGCASQQDSNSPPFT
ncbi:hypothetical protein BSKO_02336 [Bryopsis sp. KO-2023]|nr:hypothetical protein BSKO_02336 [Bryopsis sp. KO-2023]